MHLLWEGVPDRVSAVRATLQVVEPPTTNDLYFFALQASFAARGGNVGGAHIGLQWNARHPGNTAANWGGYASQERGGAVLDGTASQLPSRPNDPNTRDYPWQPRSSYRLTISAGSEPGWWRGTVGDLDSGSDVVIRELNGAGERLTSAVVWSEVFAPCNAPTVSVAWSDLEYAVADGTWRAIETVTANYQSYQDGGCSNTNSYPTKGGWVQSTNSARTTRHRSRLQRAGR